MEIALAEEEHLPAVVALLRTRGWDEDFDADLGDVYLARDDEVIACLQLVEIDEETGVLDVVLVDETRRGEGVGTALVSAALGDAPPRVYVSCREDAVPFYETLGFSLEEGGVEAAPRAVRDYWHEVGNRAPLVMMSERPS